MNLLITICARGGSKGIPGKNIRHLNGRPLIGYSIQHAQQFATQNNGIVALSTDSEDILNVAANLGVVTNYRRPPELASDTAGKIETIQHLLFYEEKKAGIKFDFLLDLDVTSPLRTLDDLNQAFIMLQNDSQALNIFSVNLAARNPYYNMVEQKENGYFHLVKPLQSELLYRQAAPKVYDMNASFYFYRRDFFNQTLKSTITNQSLIYIMPHMCFDLDHPIDFDFLSYLLENKKLNFQI
jgi:CMP-N-acetylneuraminic acid synthetase